MQDLSGVPAARVSFVVEPGAIMGFIGRNGAGKSTTIKSMLNLVHPDSGRVTMFGQDFYADEPACKAAAGRGARRRGFFTRIKAALHHERDANVLRPLGREQIPALPAAVRARRDEEGLPALVRYAREIYARAGAVARCACSSSTSRRAGSTRVTRRAHGAVSRRGQKAASAASCSRRTSRPIWKNAPHSHPR